VAIVKKAEVPGVLRRVGQALRATAMVTSQPAWELHMKGYASEEVYCTLQVTRFEGGTGYVDAKKWLTQLSFHGRVAMRTQGLTEVKEVRTLVKMVLRFDEAQGWSAIRGTNVADYLRRLIPEAAFSQIVVREGSSSATVLVFTAHVENVLKNSGHGHIYTKVHQDEPEADRTELLMLPEGTTQKEALELLKTHTAALGIAKKASPDQPRYALRFVDHNKFKEAAAALGLQHLVDGGKYKLTGVSARVGAGGVIAMMKADPMAWMIQEVLYARRTMQLFWQTLHRRRTSLRVFARMVRRASCTSRP
jgi:hypothetical protein